MAEKGESLSAWTEMSISWPRTSVLLDLRPWDWDWGLCHQLPTFQAFGLGPPLHHQLSWASDLQLTDCEPSQPPHSCTLAPHYWSPSTYPCTYTPPTSSVLLRTPVTCMLSDHAFVHFKVSFGAVKVGTRRKWWLHDTASMRNDWITHFCEGKSDHKLDLSKSMYKRISTYSWLQIIKNCNAKLTNCCVTI